VPVSPAPRTTCLCLLCYMAAELWRGTSYPVIPNLAGSVDSRSGGSPIAALKQA